MENKILAKICFIFLCIGFINCNTILITGGAGFIGSNFVKYIYDKYPDYKILVIDALTYAGNPKNIPDHIRSSNRFEFYCANILSYEVVEKLMSQSDMVVHFAAESHVTRSIQDNTSFIYTDVLGTQYLMTALRKCKNVSKFIHISTSEVYGTAEYEPMDENHPLNPRSPYAAAKAGADRVVYANSCTYDLPVVIIRPFNNYGPNQHLEKVIPRFITQLLGGKKINIHGDGSAKRDWIHVTDTCRALDLVLHHENFNDELKNKSINIGSDRAVSVLEIANILAQNFGVDQASVFNFVDDRPGQVACHICDGSLAYKILGWKPQIKFEDGLIQTVNWYRNNKYVWEDLDISKEVLISTKDLEFKQ